MGATFADVHFRPDSFDPKWGSFSIQNFSLIKNTMIESTNRNTKNIKMVESQTSFLKSMNFKVMTENQIPGYDADKMQIA